MEQDLEKEVNQITQRYQLKHLFARNLIFKWFKMKKKDFKMYYFLYFCKVSRKLL